MSENKTKVLVVDDDARLRDLLNRYLGEQGYSVRTVSNATEMNRQLARERYDLMILDLMLPGEDGLSICRRLRGGNEDMPIIMLTAKGDDVDRIVGLEVGADDYLAKPFNPRELVARIQAVLRRRPPPAPPGAPSADAQVAEFGEFRLNLATRNLTKSGDDVRAHHRRIRAAQGAGAASAHAAVARQADGARARPRVRRVRPQHRRADLAPAPARRARSLETGLHPDRVGIRLRVHSRRREAVTSDQ